MERIKQKIYNLLRWSERYTQTDMIYLAKGGSWLALGQVISTAASFLLGIAFANLLPKEIFGTYGYILSILSILVISTLGSMGTAVAQATARGYEGCLLPAIKAKIRWGTLGAITSLGLAGYYYFSDNFTLALSFLVIAIFLPFLHSFNIYASFLVGRKLFKFSVRYSIITVITATAVMVGTLYLTKNLFLILLAYLIPPALLGFIFCKITLKRFPPNKKRDGKAILYGKQLSFSGIIINIGNQLDKILTWHFLGAAPLAIYSLATTLPNQISNLFQGTGLLSLPKLSQKSPQELKATLPKKVFKFFLVMVPIVIIYIITAPFIFRVFFPQYLESVFYSQIFSLTILLFPTSLFGHSLTAQMKIKEITILRFFSATVRAVSLLILTPLFGIMGVIISILITATSHFCLALFLFKRM